MDRSIAMDIPKRETLLSADRFFYKHPFNRRSSNDLAGWKLKGCARQDRK